MVGRWTKISYRIVGRGFDRTKRVPRTVKIDTFLEVRPQKNFPQKFDLKIFSGKHSGKVCEFPKCDPGLTLFDAFPLPDISEMIIITRSLITRSSILLTYEVHTIKYQSRMKTSLTQPLKLAAISASLLFGVTNGLASFQKELVKFVTDNNLIAVFFYLDNIYICGKDQDEHDKNLTELLETAEVKNICYNDDKSIFSTHTNPYSGMSSRNSRSVGTLSVFGPCVSFPPRTILSHWTGA